MADTTSMSLVMALRKFFEIPADQMVAEFKKLTDKDKDDFVEMFNNELGWNVARTATK